MGEYCRYLVSLAGLRYDTNENGEPKDPANSFFCSCFLLSLKGQWYLVTAGHILRDMSRQAQAKKSVYQNFLLADAFGPYAPNRDQIPFDFDGAQKVFKFDKNTGMDFAFIALRPMYQKLLAANNVIAVTEADWQRRKYTRFEQYFMLGFQDEIVERHVVPRRNDYVVHGKPIPVFIHIARLKEPPESEARLKSWGFVGQIDGAHLVGDLAGMSGGPIFGITSGLRKHGIAAIQSGWLPTSRITFGCSIAAFTKMAQQLLA